MNLLIPVLRERGMIFDDYAVPGGTFRENLLRQPGQKSLRKDHYGSQFDYDNDWHARTNGSNVVETRENGHPA